MKKGLKDKFIPPHTLTGMPYTSSVLVALSGGADSSALLHLLSLDSAEHGYTVIAAHLNHGIRGDEADRDAHFCGELCKKLGVTLFTEYADIPALAHEHGKSLELEARDQRYAFFERIMKENSIDTLVTAHHAADLTESMLLHLLRGSGVGGIGAISPCRSFGKEGELYIARPLLGAEKEDILEYCAENGIDFVTDSTNTDTSYTRNALRAKVTPVLREIQPDLNTVVARFCENARQVDSFVDVCAREFISEHVTDGIPVARFNALHDALKARVLELCFRDVSGISLEYVHVKALTQLAQRSVPYSRISLPGGNEAIIRGGMLCFGKSIAPITNGDFDIPLHTGEFLSEDGVIIIIEEDPQEATPGDHYIIISRDGVTDEMHIRPRREGDTILTRGMHKSIKKLMNEKKVPRELRGKLPLLASSDEILWIPGVVISDKIKCSRRPTQDFYRITVKLPKMT